MLTWLPVNFITQTLDGFRSIFNPKITREISRSYKLQNALSESLILNFSYLIFSIVFHVFYLDNLLWILLIRRFISNTLVNLTLTKIVIDQNPFSQPYRSCGCDSGALLQASLASLFIFETNIILITILSYVPYSYNLTWLGFSLDFGQNLMEIKLSSAGMCTQHRGEILSKNNGYALGIGLSMFWVINFLSSVIYNFLSVRSYFIDDALFSLIYPYFMLAVLVREKQFSSNCPSFDLFDYSRMKIPPKVKWLLKFMMSWLNKPMVYIPKLKQFKNHQITQKVCILLYDPIDDWRTWHKFKVSRAMILFNQIYGRPIKDTLTTIREVTEYSAYIRMIPESFIKWSISKDNKILIKLISNDRLKYPLDVLIEFIEHLEKIQSMSITIKTTSPDLSNLVKDDYPSDEEEDLSMKEFEITEKELSLKEEDLSAEKDWHEIS